MSTTETLMAAGFLALAVNRLIELFVRPAKEKLPDLDMWWLFYVALGVGAVLSWYSGLNVFADLAIPVEVGRGITALGVGGGPGVLAELLGYFKQDNK